MNRYFQKKRNFTHFTKWSFRVSIHSTGNATVYLQYSTLFQKNGRTTAIQASVTANANENLLKKAENKGITGDILDLSPEGILESLAKRRAAANSETGAESGNVTTTGSGTSESSSVINAERIALIRTNKNAVLDRVNTLLAENGIEVPPDQSFELKVNAITGELSVTGIDDPELSAQFNEAIQGDELLSGLMLKTRDDLNLPTLPNTTSRNFTIGFGSMIPTPEGAEVEYMIDVTVRHFDPEGNEVAAENTAGSEDGGNPIFTFQMSIHLSTKMPSLIDFMESVTGETDETESEKASDSNSVTRKSKTVQNREEALSVNSWLDFEEYGITHEWSLVLEIAEGGNANLNGGESQEGNWLMSTSLTISGSMFYEFPQTATDSGDNSLTESAAVLPWSVSGMENLGSEELISLLNQQFAEGLLAWFGNVGVTDTRSNDWATKFAEELGIGNWVS